MKFGTSILTWSMVFFFIGCYVCFISDHSSNNYICGDLLITTSILLDTIVYGIRYLDNKWSERIK